MKYTPLHHIDTNPETNEHLAEIVESLENNGWKGLPLLVLDLGNELQLLNGCHRYAACEILNIEPEIFIIIADELDADLFDFANANSDEDRYNEAFLIEKMPEEALEILENELKNN